VGLQFPGNAGYDSRWRDITALLLADCSNSLMNLPEWINRLHPEVVLLSMAA
jgi:hypothetical protein